MDLKDLCSVDKISKILNINPKTLQNRNKELYKLGFAKKIGNTVVYAEKETIDYIKNRKSLTGRASPVKDKIIESLQKKGFKKAQVKNDRGRWQVSLSGKEDYQHVGRNLIDFTKWAENLLPSIENFSIEKQIKYYDKKVQEMEEALKTP